VWRLQNLDEPDCVHFRLHCDEGPNFSRRSGSDTRQGYYAATPSGRWLGSLNSRNPANVAAMLREALQRWNAMSKEERLLDYDPAEILPQINRNENSYPEDGLVLRVNSRDLPRTGLDPTDWRSSAWNFDYAWFTRDEMISMFPRNVQRRQTWEMPEALIRRMAMLHMADNVRGQTNRYQPAGVEEASLEFTLVRVRRGKAQLEMRGAVKLRDTERGRGFDATMFGRAVFDTNENKFEEFELVVSGERWGRTRFNARQDDEDRAPIGFVFSLASDHPTERVAPAEFGAYGWRR
jgi:hypothetical protein